MPRIKTGHTVSTSAAMFLSFFLALWKLIQRKRKALLLREGFSDEPIGLGEEAIVGLPIEEN